MRTRRWRSSPGAIAFGFQRSAGAAYFPGNEEQQFAGIVDALEGLLIDDAVAAGLRQPEIGCKIRAGRLLAGQRRELANGRHLALADFGLVEALLPQRLALGNFRVGRDLADPQVVVLENLEPALFLHLVVHAERAPADDRLLVAPSRERQDATFGALADEALIVDEAVDLLEFGFQEFGEVNRTVPS
jgi:hypothetical protein